MRVITQYRRTVPYRVCILCKFGSVLRLAHHSLRWEVIGKGRTLEPQV